MLRYLYLRKVALRSDENDDDAVVSQRAWRIRDNAK